MNIAGGILGAVAGGSQGYTQAKQQGYETQVKTVLDDMMELREKNLARFRSDLRKDENEQQAWLRDQSAIVKQQLDIDQKATENQMAIDQAWKLLDAKEKMGGRPGAVEGKNEAAKNRETETLYDPRNSEPVIGVDAIQEFIKNNPDVQLLDKPPSPVSRHESTSNYGKNPNIKARGILGAEEPKPLTSTENQLLSKLMQELSTHRGEKKLSSEVERLLMQINPMLMRIGQPPLEPKIVKIDRPMWPDSKGYDFLPSSKAKSSSNTEAILNKWDVTTF